MKQENRSCQASTTSDSALSDTRQTAGKVIFHIAFSSITNASRLMRSAAAAAASDDISNITCVGYLEEGLQENEKCSDHCEILRLPVTRFRWAPRVLERSIQWLIWTIAVVSRFRHTPVDAFQCHSLAALPAGVWLKRLSGGKAKLIYDAHELESERAGWGAGLTLCARILERALIQSVDHTFVVGELILEWYQKQYGLTKLSLLRNLPERPGRNIERNRLLRDEFGIPDEQLVFIYLGLIDQGRGYRQLIEAFHGLTGRHLIFMGDGPAAPFVAASAAEMPNVHWRRPVAIHDIVHYAAGCDVGICVIEDICLSYRYCLPNKLHETRLAGLPVIVSNLPEMARHVDKACSGWKVEPTAESLRALVKSLDREIIAKKIAGIRSPPLVWDDEKLRYLGVLSEIFET